MISYWKKNFLLVEGAIVVLVWSGAIVAIKFFDFGKEFEGISRSDAIAALGSLGGLFGAILGFQITAIAFLFSALDRGAFQLLKASKQYRMLWSVFLSLLKASGCATAVAVAGLFAAIGGVVSQLLLVALAGCSLWVFSRMVPVAWAISRLIDVEVTFKHGDRIKFLDENPGLKSPIGSDRKKKR